MSKVKPLSFDNDIFIMHLFANCENVFKLY